MRIRALITVGMLLVTQASASVLIGLKFPLSYTINFASMRGVWSGFAYGGGAAAEITFAGDAVGLEGYALVCGDRYFLPPDLFTPGAYIFQMGIQYGIDVKFHLGRSWYLGLGPVLMYTFAGIAGDDASAAYLPADSLGHDIGAAFFAGHSFHINDSLAFPLELRVIWNIWALPAVPLQLQLHAGIMYRIPGS